MRQRWETLTFLHWGYPVEVVQRSLPLRLRVEPWDGLAWVGLVAFSMRVSPPIGPVSAAITFPETNLRTYVLGPDGRPGVWFFSLDAASQLAVSTARAVLGLPYRLAAMTVDAGGDSVAYRSVRSEGTGQGAGHEIVIKPGPPFGSSELTEFDHYLTARFALWNRRGPVTMRIYVEHPPWELRRGEVLELQQDLTEAAGLPSPSGQPTVHYSEGVDVRIGAPGVVR
jgi:uncharacterized protein YqjF (DUF2071 family)